MERFIRNEILIIFKRRLAEATDDAQRQLLLKLLAAPVAIRGMDMRREIFEDHGFASGLSQRSKARSSIVSSSVSTFQDQRVTPAASIASRRCSTFQIVFD